MYKFTEFFKISIIFLHFIELNRSKYNDGTGGGAEYDLATPEEVESFLGRYSKKHSRANDKFPTDGAVHELLLATLCKEQIFGIQGGIDSCSALRG